MTLDMSLWIDEPTFKEEFYKNNVAIDLYEGYLGFQLVKFVR